MVKLRYEWDRKSAEREIKRAIELKSTASPTHTVSSTKVMSPLPTDLIRPTSYRSPLLQDTFADGDYEITFIPYDDGDPSTWEGVIFRTTPEIADDARFVSITIQTAEANVTQETYYGSDGGDPQPVDPCGPHPLMNAKLSKSQPVVPQESRPQTCFGNVAPRQFVSGVTTSSYTRAVIPQVRCGPGTKKCLNDPTACCSIPNVGPWLRCAGGLCLYAAIGCTASGPGWSACWGAWCTAGMVYCLL